MTATFPVVSALFAGLLGLLAAMLTANVISQRVRTEVSAGDGGDSRLAQAIRAHGNFIEQAPLALLLLAMAEGLGHRAVVVAVLGIAIVASRVANAAALNRSLELTSLRVFGGGTAVLTMAAVSIAVLLALAGAR